MHKSLAASDNNPPANLAPVPPSISSISHEEIHKYHLHRPDSHQHRCAQPPHGFWFRASLPTASGWSSSITGGSRGLGLALAHRFGRAGDQLVLAARNQPNSRKLARLLLDQGSVQSPADILLVPADLTDPAQAASLIDQAYAHFGRIDILINNAGIIEVGPIENQPLAAFERAMDTNFFAALHTILPALPRFLSQEKRNGRRASIVNISSIGGKVPVPHLLPYVASKFALTGFSEGLHAELRLKGVRVTTVCPGLMRTGSDVQAEFTGQAEKEYSWFALGAKTPGLAASTITPPTESTTPPAPAAPRSPSPRRPGSPPASHGLAPAAPSS